MQRLRERLREEGIVINYPVRSLRLPDGATTEALFEHDRVSEAAVVVEGPSSGLTPPFDPHNPEGSQEAPDIDGR